MTLVKFCVFLIVLAFLVSGDLCGAFCVLLLYALIFEEGSPDEI